jgi:hypothetical protein
MDEMGIYEDVQRISMEFTLAERAKWEEKWNMLN